MRCHTVRVLGAVLMLAACSSGSGKSTTSTSGTPQSADVATTRPKVTAQSPSTTRAATTTTTGCPDSGGSTAPVKTGAAQASALLVTVSVNRAGCADRVVFSFTTKAAALPSCNVAYKKGPFVEDASGAPVSVSGRAFVVVRCEPAYTYDPETGNTTYSGSKRVDPVGALHVRELVKIGDSEGVLTWVVGVDSQRPFAVAARTIPPGLSTLAITLS